MIHLINCSGILLTYNGSFAGVVVSDNIIQGQLLFAAGIAIGNCVWSSCGPSPFQGPATVSNNTFSGNWPAAVIQVTNNDVSQVGVDAGFADDDECGTPVRTLFNHNDHLNYYPPGVTGALV
jgi:hypothetical protein